MNRCARLLAALLLSALAANAPAADPATSATVARDTELREKPLGDAPVVAPLKAKATVTVTARNGAWAQVSTADGKKGYVRLLNLRTGSARKGDSGVGALASVFKTGSSGNTVATGVKGMSAESLTGAAPDNAQVEKLAGYKASEKAARDGAKLAGLKAQKVEYLPAPAKR